VEEKKKKGERGGEMSSSLPFVKKGGENKTQGKEKNVIDLSILLGKEKEKRGEKRTSCSFMRIQRKKERGIRNEKKKKDERNL